MAQARIADFTVRVAPTQKLAAVREDPADNRILECTVEGKSEYLVTRDKHLLKLKSFGIMQMIKVADFLKVVRAAGSPQNFPCRRHVPLSDDAISEKSHYRTGRGSLCRPGGEKPPHAPPGFLRSDGTLVSTL